MQLYRNPAWLLSIALLPLLPLPVFAVGGITGTKLVVTAADPIDLYAVELEPAVSMYRTRSKFNEYAHRKNLPKDFEELLPGEGRQTLASNNLGFRLTSGIAPQTEMGLFIGHTTESDSAAGTTDTGFDEVQIGLKHLLNPRKSLRFAVEAGVNYDPVSWSPNYEGGGVFTLEFSEDFTIDLDFIISSSSTIHDGLERYIQRGRSGNIGFSYVLGNLQPVLEFGFSESYSNRTRNYRASKMFYTDLDLKSSALQFDLNTLFALPATLPVVVPGVGTFHYPVPAIQETVRVWERVYTVTSGFTYDLNSQTSLAFSVTEDVAGINTTAGRAVGLAVAFVFEPDEGE